MLLCIIIDILNYYNLDDLQYFEPDQPNVTNPTVSQIFKYLTSYECKI